MRGCSPDTVAVEKAMREAIRDALAVARCWVEVGNVRSAALPEPRPIRAVCRTS